VDLERIAKDMAEIPGIQRKFLANIAAHKAHLIERIVAAAKLDWKAALGYLNVKFASGF
jgi:hypothetical protein